MTKSDVTNWRRLLDKSWTLVVRCLPELAGGFPDGFVSIVPYLAITGYSATTGEAFGSATIALPGDAAALAATLVHEFQHLQLYALLHVTSLHRDDPSLRFYTLWRDDPRPIGGVMQGVYAFFGVTAFWRAFARSHPNDRRALFELAYWRGGVSRTLNSLRHDPKLTDAGRRFVNGIAEELGQWLNERVPEDIAELAGAAADDHYAGWRLRYLRPAPEAVVALVDAWVSGVDCPIPQPPEPTPDGSARNKKWAGARTALLRLRLAEPEQNASATSVPGATEADFAYVSGDLDEAERGYRRQLDQDPDNDAAWVGLGLVLAKQGHTLAANAMLRCPELLRAVWQKIGSRPDGVPAPDEVAGWIAPATGSQR
jgi:hypothetical protein